MCLIYKNVKIFVKNITKNSKGNLKNNESGHQNTSNTCPELLGGVLWSFIVVLLFVFLRGPTKKHTSCRAPIALQKSPISLGHSLWRQRPNSWRDIKLIDGGDKEQQTRVPLPFSLSTLSKLPLRVAYVLWRLDRSVLALRPPTTPRRTLVPSPHSSRSKRTSRKQLH